MKLAVGCLVPVLLLQLSVASEEACYERYGLDVDKPGTSCADIFEKNPSSHGRSGNYLINTDHLFLTHCDMNMRPVNGWIKVADFDLTKGDNCPSGWRKITVNNVHMCRSPSDVAGCYSTLFSVNGTSYHKMRGMLRGYQKGSVDSFDSRKSTTRSINNAYVEGVSITLGNPRKHVWTYVAGATDEHNLYTHANCPCAAVPGPAPPSFVGEHYYCESGTTEHVEDTIYTDDPLWDGAGCVHPNNNCCTNVGLPWFYREFPKMQNGDIEVRICADQEYSNEAVLVDQLKLYIQ